MSETKSEGHIVERHGNTAVMVKENEKGIKERHKGKLIRTQSRYDNDAMEAERSEEIFVRDVPGHSIKDSHHYLLSKVSAEKLKRLEDMMLRERLDATKYGRRCRSIQELMEATKKAVDPTHIIANVLHPWQGAGIKVKKMNWVGPRRVC